MTRIVLELDDNGVLRFHHDAGQVVTVELYRREPARWRASGACPTVALTLDPERAPG